MVYRSYFPEFDTSFLPDKYLFLLPCFVCLFVIYASPHPIVSTYTIVLSEIEVSCTITLFGAIQVAIGVSTEFDHCNRHYKRILPFGGIL